MSRHDKIITKISRSKNLDRRVVECIVRHPLVFIANCIRDFENTRAIRIPYWGVYALLTGRKKKK